VKYLVIIIALFSTACAYSPQQITVNPQVDMTAEDYGNGRAVNVVVEDSRANKSLGSRGGIYKDTSLITISNSLTDAITRAAEASLAVQGFTVNSNDPNAATIKIIVDELSYDVPEQSVGKKVLLAAVLKLEATASGESYSGKYKTNSDRQTVVTPTMGRNQNMINTLLSDTLNRLFSDPKLKAFLSNI
jgi:uncharacterized lipoprotein